MQRELVERARRGDHEAFTALAAASVDHLYALATLVLRDRTAAEDAVQETLVRMWRDLSKLRDPDKFQPWLNRLLMNSCADAWRLRRRRGAEVHLLPTHDVAIPDPTYDLPQRDTLNRAFRRLSVDHRAVIVLRYYLGMSVPDIAAAVSVPLGTAKSRIHHAERALRAALEAEGRGADSSGNAGSSLA